MMSSNIKFLQARGVLASGADDWLGAVGDPLP